LNNFKQKHHVRKAAEVYIKTLLSYFALTELMETHRIFYNFNEVTFIKTIRDEGLPDQQLLIQYKSSSSLEVLGVLYQRYMELLYGVCLKYLKQPDDASDAVMQIFEELPPKIQRHDIDHFKSWLYTVAKNHCLMQLRTPRNLKTVNLNEEGMQSDAETHLNGILENEANFLKLEKCLQTLPVEQKQAVTLFYLEQKCYKEIATATGLEWNKIRSSIQNGRRNLKICMEKKILSASDKK